MEKLYSLVQYSLYAVMGLTILAALGVTLFSNIFYASLCLIFVLVGTAGIYLALHADFLAIVQILIYVGAVMTLVIFAIMMTQRIGQPQAQYPSHNRLVAPSLLGITALILLLAKIFFATPWRMNPKIAAQVPDTFMLGSAFMGNYVFPFEIVSVILVVALIGAVIIAKKEPR